jgi:hypothetical protein
MSVPWLPLSATAVGQRQPRPPAPRRTARAIPIVRHGATRTGTGAIAASPKTSCVNLGSVWRLPACCQALRARPLRAAVRVTAALAMRWVAVRSGRGPDGLGIVTVRCCCRPVWHSGS